MVVEGRAGRTSGTTGPAAGESWRSLGAFEQLLHGYMRDNPFQHSLLVHLGGELAVGRARQAVADLQAAHPLLRARVAAPASPGAAPTFLRDDTPISVTASELGTRWQDVVGAEQASRIDDSRGPLVRVVLVPADGGTSIVLTFAHQIVDGVGVVHLLGDLITLLNGGTVVEEPLPPSQEDALVAAAPAGARSSGVAGPGDQASDPRMQEVLAVRPFDGTPPHVSSRVLDADLTAALVTTGRARGATVQGALTAAAARVLLARGKDFVRVAMPMDLRRALKLPDVVANRFLGTSIGFAADASGDFWSMARETTEHLRSARDRSSVQAVATGMTGGAPYTPQIAEAAMTAELSTEVELSNLGVIDLPHGGPVEVVAVDGPLLATQISGQQVIGAVTFRGQLRMTNLSYTPVPGLLEDIASVIRSQSTG